MLFNLSGKFSILDLAQMVIVLINDSYSFNVLSTSFPVIASILLTPDAILDSLVILKLPINPVFLIWVPPQSSML